MLQQHATATPQVTDAIKAALRSMPQAQEAAKAAGERLDASSEALAAWEAVLNDTTGCAACDWLAHVWHDARMVHGPGSRVGCFPELWPRVKGLS